MAAQHAEEKRARRFELAHDLGRFDGREHDRATPPSAAVWMSRSTLRAPSTVSTKGIVWRRNVTPGNVARSALPSVSAG
jgi:hypothetical protein